MVTMMLIEPMMELAAHDVHSEDREVHSHALLHGQRCIERPAGAGRTARHEERRRQKQCRGRQQPEAEVVHPREGHVGRADHQRDLPVREAHEGRHDRAEHHHQAVHGGERIEELGVDQLQAGLEQLGAQQQSVTPAHEEHREREPQVHRADVLVVGRVQPPPPAVGVVVCVIIVVIEYCTH
jgi:hypothetical protein